MALGGKAARSAAKRREHGRGGGNTKDARYTGAMGKAQIWGKGGEAS